MSEVRSGPDLREGDVLVFTNPSELTARWGRGVLPTGLAPGGRYVVTDVEAHSWHTLVRVVPEGTPDSPRELGPFNEALFTHDPTVALPADLFDTQADGLVAEASTLQFDGFPDRLIVVGFGDAFVRREVVRIDGEIHLARYSNGREKLTVLND